MTCTEDETTKQVNENKLVIASAIIPFSILGALIRIGLNKLENFPGAPVFNLVYAQWIGCFIMGIVTKNKNQIFLWYHPSFAAISTGLCGSITTFSSWQFGIFKEFSNYNRYPHSIGQNVLGAISEFVVTLAMSLNGFVFGQHIGDWIYKQHHLEPKIMPRGFSIRHLNKIDVMVIIFGILSWLGVIFASIFSQHLKEILFACVFAPVGAIIRWSLSFYNVRIPKFPIGTFIANIAGTIILAGLGIIQSSRNTLPLTCSVVDGLADGFCGCLTTISTFIVELTTLKRKSSYTYGITSIVIAQCFMFIIMGSYIWTTGLTDPSCL